MNFFQMLIICSSFISYNAFALDLSSTKRILAQSQSKDVNLCNPQAYVEFGSWFILAKTEGKI